MQQNVTKCHKIFEKINFVDTVHVKGPYKIYKKIEKTNFLETVFFLSGENFHAQSAAQCASFEHNINTKFGMYRQFSRKRSFRVTKFRHR